MSWRKQLWVVVVIAIACVLACEQHRARSTEPPDSPPPAEPAQAQEPESTPQQRLPHDSPRSPSILDAGPDACPSKTTLALSDAARDALVARRPYVFTTPRSGGKSSQPMPLFVYLHGYGSSSKRLREVLDVEALARSRGVLLATPDGSQEPQGRRFWNATPACCNFSGSNVDDVQYIAALIDDVKQRANVDSSRIFVVGHSNGGFMAHRLACELSDRVVGIASVAGAAVPSDGRCQPQAPVAVLQVHGDADQIISFEGGHALGKASLPRHPSALESVALWAKLNDCEISPRVTGTIDIESRLPGPETTISRYSSCREGASVELWAVKGGSHFVAQERAALELIHDFLMSNPRTASGIHR